MGEENVKLNFIFKGINGEEYNINPDDIQEFKEESLVNHPRHYNREGAIECIDEMEMIYGPEPVMWFCLLNAHKYRYRAGLKDNGYRDIEKSDWYMNKFKEMKEKVYIKKSDLYINKYKEVKEKVYSDENH